MQRVPGSVDQCPVCRDPLFAGYPDRAIALCRSCKCAHHQDCWTYAGGCSQFGCGGADFVAGKAVFREDRTEALETELVTAAPPPGMGDRWEVETKGTIKAGDPLIYVRRSLIQRIVRLSEEMLEDGVSGILAGERCSWLGTEYSRVDDALPFLRPRPATSFVSEETWGTELELSGRLPLGWWAVKRGRRLCLEAQELRLQRLCFACPWMCGILLDPGAEMLGFFGWKEGSIVSVGFRLVKDGGVRPA